MLSKARNGYSLKLVCDNQRLVSTMMMRMEALKLIIITSSRSLPYESKRLLVAKNLDGTSIRDA